MTNFDIDKALKGIPNFRGTYSKDMLPRPKSKHDSVVVNLEDFADGNGTHWTCIYGNEYFDSFGLLPPDIVQKWMKTKHSEIFYNSTKLQMDDSVLCGLYCIHYIQERNKGRHALDVLLDFTQHPSEYNEDLVK